MPIEITLCRCYFGGDVCSYCGSSGVIIKEVSIDFSYIGLPPKDYTGKIKHYLRQLKTLKNNVNSNCYNLETIKRNIKRVHNGKRDFFLDKLDSEKYWIECEELYEDLINKIDSFINISIQNVAPVIYLFDMVYHNQDYFFFSFKDEMKTNLIKCILYEKGSLSDYYIDTGNVRRFIQNNKIESIEDNVVYLRNLFSPLKKTSSFKSNIISYSDIKPKIKFYLYNCNTNLGIFYHLNWIQFMDLLQQYSPR